MQTTVEVQWGIHMQCGRHVYSGAYVSNMKCFYTNAPGHIIDCIEFVRGICIDIIAYYLNMK